MEAKNEKLLDILMEERIHKGLEKALNELSIPLRISQEILKSINDIIFVTAKTFNCNLFTKHYICPK